MSANISDTSLLHVFVSFCGSDIAFADKLIQGLNSDERLKVSYDPDTTIEEDEWKALINSMIAEADAVILVLSPDSAQTCAWEIECAHQHSKRVLAVQCTSFDRTKIPTHLDRVKRVQFSGDRSFSRAMKALIASLTANGEWLCEHTRILNLARKWEDAGRRNEMLLSGPNIVAAKMWTLSRPTDAPKPTDLHLTFISISEAVEAARNSAAHEARADMVELEMLANLHEQNKGFQPWVRQAYVVVACWLALLAVALDWQSTAAQKHAANAKKYVVEGCRQPADHRPITLAGPFN